MGEKRKTAGKARDTRSRDPAGSRRSEYERTSEESGTIGGRKEKEFDDHKLATGKHPTI